MSSLTEKQLLGDFQQRYYKRFYGTYTGKVLSRDDSDKGMKLKCSFPAHFGNDTAALDWAFPKTAAGGGYNNCGIVTPIQVGDIVYLEFIDGEMDHPVWSPGPWHTAGKNGMPLHAQGEADICDQGIKGTHGIPKSCFNGQYGFVNIWQTKAGHLVEMDDTPGAERVQVYHKTGSCIEILPDGTITVISNGSVFEAVLQDKGTQIDKNESHNVGQNYEEVIGGNYTQTVNGDVTHIWKGEQKNDFGKLENKTRGDQKYDSGGNLTFSSTANEQHEVGGSRSVVVNSVDNAVVLGPKQTYITNTQNTDPNANSLLLHAMNGKTTVIGTDPTGLAVGGYIDIAPAPTVATKLYAGPTPKPELQLPNIGTMAGSGLVLDGTGVGTVLHSAINMLIMAKAMITLTGAIIRLGGTNAVHPLLKGDMFLLGYMTHTHPTAVGPSGPAVDPVAMTALSTQVFTG